MEHWLWIILAALFFECKGEDRVIQPTADVTAAEGGTVTLDCTFETTDSFPYLFWYKQEENDFPKFLLRRYSGTKNTQDSQENRFDATIKNKSVPLTIQKLQVSDSAVYYCAVKPAQNKMIFGSGTRLTIDPREDYEPSYYRLTEENTTFCLATGFSRYNALSSKTDSLNWSQVVRISGDSLYNSVVLLPHGEEKCPEKDGQPPACVELLKKGPTVNTVSLVVLGLRLLFIKTVIFNFLMTLRLWISQ